jgi:MFS family permease
MKPVFYASFALYALACFTLFFIKSQRASCVQTEPNVDYSFRNLVRNRKLLKYSLFFAMLMFVLLMFRSFIPKFIADAYKSTDFQIGVLGSVSYASSAVLGVLLGRLGDKSGKPYPLALTAVLNSLSMVLLLLSGDFSVLAVSFALIGASYMTWSLMNSIIGPSAPEACRARWVAVPQVISMFASFVAPYIGGFLYAFSPQYPFMVAVILMPVLAILAVRLFKN